MKIHVNLAENPQQNQPMLNKKNRKTPWPTTTSIRTAGLLSVRRVAGKKPTLKFTHLFRVKGRKKNLVRREKDGYLQNYDLDLLNLSSAEVCKLNIL